MIGLGSYAFFWQSSNLNPHPITLVQILEHTRSAGIDLFQICDYEQITSMSPSELDGLSNTAKALGIDLELGTRGTSPSHLGQYLEIAKRLDAKLIRSMVQTTASEYSLDKTVNELRELIKEFELADVVLALETYEQIATEDLLTIVEKVGSQNLGICLDVANVVARLENPKTCAEQASSKTLNLHVKDFAFSRQDGWVGFTFAGAGLGDGLLDYDHLVQTVKPNERNINQIIEHWVPWQGDIESTIALEKNWTAQSIDYLRSRN